MTAASDDSMASGPASVASGCFAGRGGLCVANEFDERLWPLGTGGRLNLGSLPLSLLRRLPECGVNDEHARP
jgi:hypothetical protein